MISIMDMQVTIYELIELINPSSILTISPALDIPNSSTITTAVDVRKPTQSLNRLLFNVINAGRI